MRWILFAASCTTTVAPLGAESESEAGAEAATPAPDGGVGATACARRGRGAACELPEPDAGMADLLAAPDLGPPPRCESWGGGASGACHVRRADGSEAYIEIPCCAVDECARAEPPVPPNGCFYAGRCTYSCESIPGTRPSDADGCRIRDLASTTIDGRPCCVIRECVCAMQYGATFSQDCDDPICDDVLDTESPCHVGSI